MDALDNMKDEVSIVKNADASSLDSVRSSLQSLNVSITNTHIDLQSIVSILGDFQLSFETTLPCINEFINRIESIGSEIIK